jgi:hypothetical protein
MSELPIKIAKKMTLNIQLIFQNLTGGEAFPDLAPIANFEPHELITYCS